MNTQMERSTGHPTYEEDPRMHEQDVGIQAGHNDESHGDKKSVLKKVKAKAKKIKESIVEHVGHGHELREDDEDDEMDKDPEIHGIHSTQSFRPGEVGVTKQHEPRLGDRTAVDSGPVSTYQTFDPTTARYTPGQDERTLGWSRTDTGRPKDYKEQPYASKNTPVVATERPIGMEKDPQGPKDVGEARHPANYQAKVADPSYTSGTHGTVAEERNTGKLDGILGNPEHLEKDPHAPRDPGEKPHAENYEAKVADPTGEGSEEIGVTPILHQLDKMNIYQEPQQEPNVRNGQKESMFKPKDSPEDQKISTGSHNQFSPEPITSETSKFLQTPEYESQSSGLEGAHKKSEQEQGSYTEKISSAAAMVADKAKQATNSVTSKLGYGSSSDQHPTTTASLELHDKQPEAGGYGEKISTATAAIADKAVQAKDVVATKLGYGGAHEGQGASKGGSVVETVKGTIAPVYDKVAEMGSTMASKVHGSDAGHEVGPNTTPGPPTAGTDKGVSVKQYLAEKLKPGEDDKALSDVITEALPLHKRKEDVSKVEEEAKGEKVNVKGKVTESEEVARQLGRSEETSYDHAGTGLASPGKGVIDRIKDAANFWYQKTGATPATETTEGNEGSSSISSKEDEHKRD